jgi:DNA-binding transcriptional MocR family regulator
MPEPATHRSGTSRSGTSRSGTSRSGTSPAGTRVADLIVRQATDRSSRGLATTIGRLVSGGELAAGTRLPTVRELSRALDASPTTVSAAWRHLARAGLVETRGRNGTFVANGHRNPDARRYRVVVEMGTGAAVDLSTGTPDPLLLPEISDVLGRVSRRTLTTSYQEQPVLPELDELLRDRWPFEPEAITVVDGALDAIDRITTSVVRYGDRVLVEEPCFPPVLDLLDLLGAEPIPLRLDEHGIVPDALNEALDWDPVLWHLQPRAQNPTGISTTPGRLRELAAVMRTHPRGARVLVVEDDHSGDIATAPPVSMGRHLPRQVVHVLSFSKSHGPDLRLAAVGGPGDLVEQLTVRRMLGPGWSSRILQAVLVELLRSPGAIDVVAHARETYRERRRRMADALRELGVPTGGSDGINLWVPTADERTALVALASQGIAVAPGSPFRVAARGDDHLRVTVGLVRDGHQELATRLARACIANSRSASPGR